MIFAVSMEDQTFVRYVAADGTSMILHSFDYKADLINASLSSDFRFLSLTELVNKNGNKYYSSQIYDVQNPQIKSDPITSKELIKGEIECVNKYSIVYLINDKIYQYSISVQENTIILSKDKLKNKIRQIIWSYYSPCKDILSVLSKYNDKFLFHCNYLNSETFYSIKSINEQNQNEKNFYSANFHNYFSLFQQCFTEDPDYDQLHIHFFPNYKHLIVNIPKNSIGSRLNCIQYYSVVFAFIPNHYICIVDIREMKVICFDGDLSKMPVSPEITVYDEGMICDNKEGIVYSTRINLACLKNLSDEKEIEAAAIISAKIKCTNYFYIAPNEKVHITNSEKSLNNEESSSEQNSSKSEKIIHLNEFTRSSNFDIGKKEVFKSKIHSDSEDNISKNNSSRNLFIDSSYYNVNDNSNNLNANQTKSVDLKSSENISRNSSFKKSFSFDINLQQQNMQFLDNLSIEYQRMYGKVIVDKLIISNVFDFLMFPHQISMFIKEFIKLNKYGSSDNPIPALFLLSKKSRSLPMRVPLEIKRELTQIDKNFPTTGIMNRYDVFLCLSKYLIDEKKFLSIIDAYKKAMELIRKQNSLIINLKDSFLMWQFRGKAFKFRKFLVTFCLYSELSFMSLPQIIEVCKIIAKYAKLYFSKTIKEMMIAFDIYGPYLYELDKNDLKYWKNRVNIQNICNTESKQPKGKKQEKKKLINTFTVPYFRIRNQKVFRVYHYSNIP